VARAAARSDADAEGAEDMDDAELMLPARVVT
jgi:hypothetical protein